MLNLDSLTLKYFFEENFDFINGAIVQKIQLPSRHEIILNLRNLNHEKQENKKLYININPKYPHICFIDEKTSKLRNIEIPKNPPMFCMQLRKYLNGSKIKDFRLVKYERIIELYFDYFDEIGSLTKLCLALEFMGKHSNVILYNATSKIIIGSIHNISAQKSSVREVYGGINYIYPPQKNKLDILNTSFSTFHEIAKANDIKLLSENFYYFSQNILSEIFKKFNSLEDIFSFMQNLEMGKEKRFIIDFWAKDEKNLNQALDDYFSKILFNEILSAQKVNLKKVPTKQIKKLSDRLNAVVDEKKVLKYKLMADYIMAYMYNIKPNQEFLEVDDLKIPLEINLSANENAQKYYAKYKKMKSTYEYSLSRANEAQKELEYLEGILFNIENSSSFEELNQIKQELIEMNYLEKKPTKQNSEKNNIQIEKIEFQNYQIYLGKNNKQNDYLISKIAKNEDLWFHGQGFPSSHVILKVLDNNEVPKEVMEFCAKLTKENSKAKNSSKAPIIMTKRKNLKKPPNTYPGYVTYKNETEIVI